MSVFSWKKKFIPLITLGAMTVVIALVFQNCGNARFGSDTSDANSLNSLQNCTDPNCTQIINGNGSCGFNGQTIQDGDSITAYLNSSGTSCASETRTCNNGVLSGSYAYATCSVSGANSCLFNGQTVADGDSVTAYLSSAPASGQSCQSETRVCHDGALTGSFQFATCTPSSAGSCLFNGQTLASGSGTFAYKTSTVPAGDYCRVEFRLCANGTLGGSFMFASCTPDAPAACVFNGQTVPSGSTVVGYQNSSVGVGHDCVYEARVCNNGALSGSFNYASCTVNAPAACLFDGLTVPSGASVIGYLASSVGPGEVCQKQARSCVNGALSGAYPFSSCTVEAPASCQFNGQTVAHGDSRVAYKTSSVPAGENCEQETRTCNNGTMSGAYTFATCTPAAPASCKFGARDVASGETVVAFKTKTVAAGEECLAENRKCNNGTLSGSFTFDTCTAAELRSCTFNNQSVRSGSSVTAYKTATVAYGHSCIEVQQSRTCVDGTLTGTATFPTCTVEAPKSCAFNGRSIAHGAFVEAYTASQVEYGKTCDSVKQKRTCSNGTLSGSGTYETCSVKPAVSCTLDGKTYASGTTVTAYSSKTVVYGKTCASVSASRTCTNGAWSGSASYAYTSCAVNQPVSCKMGDGTVVAHGATRKGFVAKTVAYGKVCGPGVDRTCNNGVLSGSGEYSSCTVQAPVGCTLPGGKVIAHGGSVKLYSAVKSGYGQTCEQLALVRTCSNGTLSGSASYIQASCVEGFRWVNVKYGTTQTCRHIGGDNDRDVCTLKYNAPTHAATCAGVGMVPATGDPGGQGICASGERRPSKGTAISYWLGTWGGDLTGGTFTVTTSYGVECYRSGQKQDHDRTDMVVAYLCAK